MIDNYGREIPKHAHGTANLKEKTSSTREIMDATMELYEKIVNPQLLIKRINVTANRIVSETSVMKEEQYEQLDFFTDYNAIEKQLEEEKINRQKEKKLQQAIIDIKRKYGKNSVLKGMNFEEGGTMRERNELIGGHKE